tara:strand:- start:1270 stop:1593 length:324 start_codon:yes stop_codon:yes gene_type:complete
LEQEELVDMTITCQDQMELREEIRLLDHHQIQLELSQLAEDLVEDITQVILDTQQVVLVALVVVLVEVDNLIHLLVLVDHQKLSLDFQYHQTVKETMVERVDQMETL